MLRLTVEIWPRGNRLLARTLASANIGNISGLADMSDYVIEVSEGDNPLAGTPAWSVQGHIFRHNRNASVWKLVAKAATWAANETSKKHTERDASTKLP
jgi:hypothetical protein